MAYFRRAHKQGLRHVEMFFDPQTHTERGVDMATVVGGLRRAITDAQSEMGISGRLIMCFLRHLTEEDAFATLEAVEPFKEHITGIGLDSGEAGNPPAKFERVRRHCCCVVLCCVVLCCVVVRPHGTHVCDVTPWVVAWFAMKLSGVCPCTRHGPAGCGTCW